MSVAFVSKVEGVSLYVITEIIVGGGVRVLWNKSDLWHTVTGQEPIFGLSEDLYLEYQTMRREAVKVRRGLNKNFVGYGLI